MVKSVPFPKFLKYDDIKFDKEYKLFEWDTDVYEKKSGKIYINSPEFYPYTFYESPDFSVRDRIEDDMGNFYYKEHGNLTSIKNNNNFTERKDFNKWLKKYKNRIIIEKEPSSNFLKELLVPPGGQNDMSRLEILWSISSAIMFTQFLDENRKLKAKLLANFSFPIFRLIFSKMLKERGFKEVSKVLDDWRHVLLLTFSILVNNYKTE